MIMSIKRAMPRAGYQQAAPQALLDVNHGLLLEILDSSDIEPDFQFCAAVIGSTVDDLKNLYNGLQQSLHMEAEAGTSLGPKGEIDMSHIFLLQLIEMSGIEVST
ncbi:hypothetical protein N7541_003436 [Penicillium brevicompactum]|uniref:Uncharacterized protein n=1 Tax=Penicillium brevicompactum TaxID=5074 RepID=A0A9W9UYX0_PENBR|nr:hypothetical protein N7541_003436 [Penicillium brevicompactum]